MSEVFQDGLCAQCTSKPWTQICRGCCLSFCDRCSDRKIHHCVRRDEHVPEPVKETKGKKKKEGS